MKKIDKYIKEASDHYGLNYDHVKRDFQMY